MNHDRHKQFIFQFQSLLKKLKSEKHDHETNLTELHREQMVHTLKAPNLPHDEFSQNMNRLEVIKKEIAHQERQLTKAIDKIRDTEFDLYQLEKNEEKSL